MSSQPYANIKVPIHIRDVLKLGAAYNKTSIIDLLADIANGKKVAIAAIQRAAREEKEHANG